MFKKLSITVGLLLTLLSVAACNQTDVTAPEQDLAPQANYKAQEQELLLAHAQFKKTGDSTLPGRYIVQFRDLENIPARARELARKHGFDLGHTYQHAIGGFSAKIPAQVAEMLRNEVGVLRVEPDRLVELAAQNFPTGIDRIEVELNPSAAIDELATDVDVDIAIIDSGIDYNHPDLNAVGGVKFIFGNTGNNYMDNNGHGTHVSGTAAARDNGQGVVGVAPGARLWGVKVINLLGLGTQADIIKGIDWVAARGDEIEVANMSLGGTGWSNAYHDAVANLVAQGVVLAVAAGNSTQDIYGADGVMGTNDDTQPAAFPEAATISALADADGLPGGLGGMTSYGPDDSFASLSNYSRSVHASNPVVSPGAAIDFMMPGIDILSSVPGNGYDSFSGTSMASPHAAGLFALYIAANGRANDAAGVYAIRQAVIDMGAPQGGPNGLAVANDPDANPEPIGWASASQVPYSDVSVLHFTGDASVAPGGDLHMTVAIGNRGGLPVTDPFTVSIAEIESGQVLASRTLPGLASGEWLGGNVTFTVPSAELRAAVPPGSYTLVCSHDHADPVAYRDARTIEVQVLSSVARVDLASP